MKKILLLIGLLFLSALTSFGQNRVNVRQETFAIVGQSVHVEMTINLNNTQIPTNAFVLLTPILKSGSTTMDLPSVMINGKNRDRKYNRLVALNKAPNYVHSTINAGDTKSARSCKYSVTVPYEMWMSTAELALREDQSDCGNTLVPMSYELIAKTIEDRNPPVAPPYRDVQMNFAVSFKVPNPEPIKNRSESGKAYLDFRVGRSEILPDFGNNAAELDKIGELIRSVKSNEYATITGINIEGYASPEGSYNSNVTLSNNRAVALKNNIRSTYGFRESLFRVAGKGEDWAGFENLVSQSYLNNKDQVLNIIRSSAPFDTRERELKALDGGNTFKLMVDEMFPKLRRSDYELFYTIVPFTVEKGKEVIRTAPSNLSLNEMFLIAESYPKGSREYNEVFEIAARVYPNNDISNINAAANALAQNDLDSAQRFLSKISNHDAAYNNNMGVLSALRGDYAKAAEFFAKASADGNSEAQKNAAEVAKINE